jgi:ankyrin repeat protein
VRRLVASQIGDVATVRRLVASGENVNQRDESGRTALHWAANMGHAEAVEVLVQLGADKEARLMMERARCIWRQERGRRR